MSEENRRGHSSFNGVRDLQGNVVQAASVDQVHFNGPRGWVVAAWGGAVVLAASVVTAVALSTPATVLTTELRPGIVPPVSARGTEIGIQGGWRGSCGPNYYPASAAGSVLASRPEGEIPVPYEGKAAFYDVEITAQAEGPGDVLLTGMRVVDFRRNPAPTTGILASVTCGGPTAARSFEVDLEQPNPTPKPVHIHDDSEGDFPAVPFPFKVSAGDPEVFYVLPVWKQPCDCRFSIEITWVMHGEPGTTRVDNGGVGFRLILGSNLPHYWWDDSAAAWVNV